MNKIIVMSEKDKSANRKERRKGLKKPPGNDGSKLVSPGENGVGLSVSGVDFEEDEKFVRISFVLKMIQNFTPPFARYRELRSAAGVEIYDGSDSDIEAAEDDDEFEKVFHILYYQ